MLRNHMINRDWDMLVLQHCCYPTRWKNSEQISSCIPYIYLLSTPTLVTPVSCKSYMLGHVRLIWCLYRWWTPGGTTREARNCHHHLQSPWSSWWWCRHSCFSRWPRTCRTWGKGMGMHPLMSEIRGESSWKDTHPYSSTLLMSQNQPIYKSTSTKTIVETIKFSHLSPYKPGSQLKPQRISNQLAYNQDHSNST